MKKFTLFTMAIFMLAACATTELDEIANGSESPVSSTRSNGDTPHFLDQLQGIPVTIYSPKGIASVDKDLYLTRTGTAMSSMQMLPERTGDSLYTQYWYLEREPNSNLFRLQSAFVDIPASLAMSLLGITNPNSYHVYSHYLYYGSINGKTQFYFPHMVSFTQNPNSGYLEVLSDSFNPVHKHFKMVQNNKTYYFRADYGEGSQPYFKEYDSSNFRNFRIISVEDFYLQSMEYSLESGDGAVPLPSFIDEIVVNNQTPTTQQMTATFVNKVTEQTTFSSANGGSESSSLSISAGVTVKTPWVNIDTSISYDTSSASNWNLTEGTTQTQEDSRQYSFTLTVPAYSSYRATVSVARYEAQATYTASFRGQTTGFLVEETGKWNGITAGLITYDIVDNSTNQSVARIYGTPDITVDLTNIQSNAVFDFRKDVQSTTAIE